MAYGSRVVQRDLTFTVHEGDVFIIMGGSGCGKSTLMRHLIGLQRPAKGSVLYGSVNFWNEPDERREAMMRRWGILYQSGALWSLDDARREHRPAPGRIHHAVSRPGKGDSLPEARPCRPFRFRGLLPGRDQRRHEETGRPGTRDGPRPGNPVPRRAVGGARPDKREPPRPAHCRG